MSPTIRIDDEVFKMLQASAQPLVDTPNDVIRRLLRLDGSSDGGGNSKIRYEIRRILDKLIDEDPDFELDHSTKALIKFAPKSWTSPQLRNSGAESGRILTFYFLNLEVLRLHLEIQPPRDPSQQEIRARIHEVALSTPPFEVGRRELSPVYARIFRRDILGPEDYEQPLDWIEEQVKRAFDSFKENDFPIIDKAVQGIEFA
jgi:hypothetical protein